jgi:pantoate--beta-alanine ligase
MKLLNTTYEVQNHIKKIAEMPVGLVPTMGALHAGHLALVQSAFIQCPLIVVTIYVNPEQFNDISDFKSYPRNLNEDLKLLKKVLRKNDIVFSPDNKEIYPEKDNRVFRFGNLDNVMEALHRPGHFNGVAKVVSRLFDIVHPDLAFFGMKDLQQVAVIKELVRQTGRKIDVTTIPVMREVDGLAMSSRNRLLDPSARREAAIIYKTISFVSEMMTSTDIPEIKLFVENSINRIKGFNLEYFEIVDDTELIPVNSIDDIKEGKRYFGCIAVKAGKVRLIDNIEISGWSVSKG